MIEAARLAALADYQPGVNALARLAERYGVEAARWAAEQADLRGRAATKFSGAAEMLFIREALEQATHERVAAYHASLFPQGAFVADLTCGVGGDLLALAKRGPCVGYDLDPDRASCAAWNLRPFAAQASVVCANALAAEWTWHYAIADPSRRVQGRRTLDPADFEPSPEEVARRFSSLSLGLLKLSPVAQDAWLESLGAGLEFVSFAGECREALVLCGAEAPAGRWAAHVESGERIPAGTSFTTVDEPGDWLFDADPAAVRAHALGAFGLPVLGDSNGYLTGGPQAPCPWLRAYPVLWSGAADPGRVRAEARRLCVRIEEVKQRGAGVDPTRWRLPAFGERRAALAFWRQGRSVRVAIVGLG